jgi:hypothetical protein
MISHSKEAMALRKLLQYLEEGLFLDFDDGAFIPSEDIKREIRNAIVQVATFYDPYIVTKNSKSGLYEVGTESSDESEEETPELIDLINGDELDGPEEEEIAVIYSYIKAMEKRLNSLCEDVEKIKSSIKPPKK